MGLKLNSAWRWSRTRAEEPYNLRITPMHKWTVFIATQESESEHSYFKSNCYRTTGSFHCCNLEKLNHSLNAFACLQHFISSRILRHRRGPLRQTWSDISSLKLHRCSRQWVSILWNRSMKYTARPSACCEGKWGWVDWWDARLSSGWYKTGCGRISVFKSFRAAALALCSSTLGK